jgi:predicted aldo/keto reductase-like oxidoreductase
MEKRRLGNTGAEVTILGLGGFHLLEIPAAEAAHLVNAYLDAGGNYVETAASYGDGESEQKIGAVMKTRRHDCFLATKCGVRDRAGAAETIDRSLRNLQTDHVDLLFMHGVQTPEQLEQILSDDGALRAAEAAREAGKVSFIGITGHGQPDVLIEALGRYHFDVVMTGLNYYDRFNFPKTEEVLLPLAQERGTAFIGMKALADGLLYKSPEAALRYAWTRPIATVVAGVNTREMLGADLALAERYEPMTAREEAQLFYEAPELGTYVCRQCEACVPHASGLDIPRVFLLEGWYDRQMRDGTVREAAEFALRDRLRFWFGQQDKARGAYAALAPEADVEADFSDAEAKCPYGVPITRKLKYAHYKLSGEKVLF